MPSKSPRSSMMGPPNDEVVHYEGTSVLGGIPKKPEEIGGTHYLIAEELTSVRRSLAHTD